MKVILFICCSLLVTLLHVATMPIHAMGEQPITAQIEIDEQDSKHQHQHHKMMISDHHHSNDHCPMNHDSCCLTLTIPLNHIDAIQLVMSESNFPPLTISASKAILETPYKPPKFLA